MSATDPLQKSVRVGELIAGKYRVDGVLGTGGMGVVLAATHLDLDRIVALKLMRSELAQHPQAVDRLVQEARLAAQFRGEHVCRVLDVGTVSDGTPYIVMEYLEGSDLATLIAQHGPLEVETAVDFMLETAEALAEAHAAHIIHRDLKPENLFVARLLDGSPCIKVLDFGISKQLGVESIDLALTNPSTALGSPFYMAPEQMRSARDADRRADLWAVGAILFELLTGRQAFDGPTLPEVCGAVMGTNPPRATALRPEVPEGLSAVIARCLEKDPEQRYQSVLALAIALVPFGSTNAELSLERIERMLARGVGNPQISLNPPLTSSRQSGVRTTPSGLRERALTRPDSTSGANSSLTAGVMEKQTKPRRTAWVASLVGVALFGLVAVFSLRHPSPLAPLVQASTTTAPSTAAALQPALTNPEPAAPVSAAAPPPPTPAPHVPAAAHPPPRAVPRPARAAPVRPAAAQARAEASSPPTAPAKKSTDAAAAWDSSSFGPRH